MIDWFTTGAQIINFLILVFLLKKFLYGPIISAMDRREEKIAGRLKEGEEKWAEAENEIDMYRRKNEDFESQRAEMLAKARETAEEQERALMEKAREEVQRIRARWHEAVMQEKEAFLRNLQRKIAEEVYAVARRAFADLADATLEEHMTDKFLKRINTLDEGEVEAIRSAMKNVEEGFTVASSFDVQEQKQRVLSEVVRRMSGGDASVRFVRSDDLVCGIELRAEGYSLGWNIDEYLKSIEDDFGRAIGGKQ